MIVSERKSIANPPLGAPSRWRGWRRVLIHVSVRRPFAVGGDLQAVVRRPRWALSCIRRRQSDQAGEGTYFRRERTRARRRRRAEGLVGRSPSWTEARLVR
jgi:hypothetical protein